jgi:hypothetical protein
VFGLTVDDPIAYSPHPDTGGTLTADRDGVWDQVGLCSGWRVGRFAVAACGRPLHYLVWGVAPADSSHGGALERGYCHTDVQRTADLYQRLIAELDGLNLAITQRGPSALASLSREVLDALPVSPHVRRADPLPGQVEGRFMSAFYGGRAECRIRRTEVAVSLEDSRPCTRRVRMLGCGTTSSPNAWTPWMPRTTSKPCSTPPLSTSCLIVGDPLVRSGFSVYTRAGDCLRSSASHWMLRTERRPGQ